MATVPSQEAVETVNDRAKPPFLRRVRIQGYKSIAFCDVTLDPLTILVGRNASGKSNFLDALAFLAHFMRFNLTESVYLHGGSTAIICRSAPTRKVVFELNFSYSEGESEYEITYKMDFAVQPDGTLAPPGENLRVSDKSASPRRELQGGPQNLLLAQVFEWVSKQPPYRSSLANWGKPPAPMLSERIAGMRVYNFVPDAMRGPQKSPSELFLERDGRNLACVIQATGKADNEALERVGRYILAITESVHLQGVAEYGDYKTLRFQVDRNADAPPLEFDAAGMSDGSLRALAALAAAFQNIPPYGPPSLVAVEEPETALHPAAMRALVDALDEATLRTQILLTTHSADMLDNPTIRPENVRVVRMVDGQTVIGPVDGASVEIVRQHLDTLGGLERQNQLELDLDDLDRQRRLSRNRQEPTA